MGCSGNIEKGEPPKKCVFIVHTKGVPTSDVLYVPLGFCFVFFFKAVISGGEEAAN